MSQPSTTRRPADSPNRPNRGPAVTTADELWERGLCAQTDPEAFFPNKGGSNREAKRICARCDVREDCLAYALAHDERFGIWGGTSELDRKAIRRAARTEASR